jgi:hypothetical protein
MTAIAPYEPSTNGVAHYTGGAPALPEPPRTVLALQEWAAGAAAAHQVAQNLVQTSFVPEAFRNKPYEATAAILAGSEVGLSPMASLRAFDSIQGTAAPRAMTLRAIVQSRGHDIWVVEANDTRAIVEGQRAGSAHIHRSEWTIARARDLGLLGKHNWKAQKGAMLVARATAECCRLVASDAILGMPYSAEEIWDGNGSMEQGAPEPEGVKRTARRRSAAPIAAVPDPAEDGAPSGPPLPGEDDEPGEDMPPAVEAATRAQLTKLHATLNDFGVTERADKLQMVGLLARRELASSSDLTKDEASNVIDVLDRLSQQGDQDDRAAALAEHLADLEQDDTAADITNPA